MDSNLIIVHGCILIRPLINELFSFLNHARYILGRFLHIIFSNANILFNFIKKIFFKCIKLNYEKVIRSLMGDLFDMIVLSLIA